MNSSLKRVFRCLIPKRWRSSGYLTALATKRTQLTIQSGPFRGMRYIATAHYSAYVPKLVGIYERELAPFVEACCKTHYPLIIDIGAAEGYYAVGFGWRCPASRVIAFEQSSEGRALLSDLKEVNRVQNVELRGHCDIDGLNALLDHAIANALIICDCEGYEMTLLDPERVPALTKASILVETHDVLTPGICQEIRSRFSLTHDITEVPSEDRTASDYPFRNLYVNLMPKPWLELVVSEMRGGTMVWLWMTPKAQNLT